MRLPWERDKLSDLKLSPDALRHAILRRREVIRYHRDQKGDDRCWVDDYSVWEMLDDTPDPHIELLRFDQKMWRCNDFYHFRRSDHPDPRPNKIILNRARWDDDIHGIGKKILFEKLVTIQEAIRRHRDIEQTPRTVYDDQLLYGILPEKVVADFRLPPGDEFLGEAKAPHAGCPSFWRSHKSCQGTCDFRKWGPCK